MLNNKGFVVSTILYTILLAFLLFLGVTLSIFSSATSTIGNATDDLVNSSYLSIAQVVVDDTVKGNICTNGTLNIEGENFNKSILAQITSKYGILYWPKDFVSSDGEDLKSYKNVYVYCSNEENGTSECTKEQLDNLDKYDYFFLRVVQDGDEENAKETTIGNVCKFESR